MLARTFLMLIVMAMSLPALAVELDLSATSSAQYDTNVARVDGNKKGDFSFRMGPTIRLRDEIGKFRYNAQYTPNYQKFVQQTQFDKLSHFAGGSMEYQIGNKTDLSLTERFQFTQSVNQQSIGADPDLVVDVPEPETQRGDIYLNTANFVASHSFTPRTTGQLTVSHQYFDSSNRNTSRNTNLSGVTSLTYALGARDRIGFGGGVSWQQFEGVQGQPGSDTITYRVFASWLHNFGENTVLTVRAGPALITSNQDSPDPEGVAARYPYIPVTQAGTIPEIYARLGLVPPPAVTNLLGDPTDPASLLSDDVGLIIPAGSILVPDPDTCLFVTVPSGFGISPENCAFSRIARPGQNANNDAFITQVQTPSLVPPQGLVNFAYLPGSNTGNNDDSSITYFGEITLAHDWTENLLSKIAYSRSDNGVSSLGSSTVADRAYFETTWQASRRLNLGVRADWVQRKSANELVNTFRVVDPNQPITMNPATLQSQSGVAYTGALLSVATNNAVDTTYYSASARAAYRATRRLTLSARITYQKQDTNNQSTTSDSDFGDFIAFVGFRYDLDPIKF